MGEPDLHTAEERRDAGAVRGQVGEEVGNNGCRGDGRLEHTNEGVAIQRLDDLLLQTAHGYCQSRGYQGRKRVK